MDSARLSAKCFLFGREGPLTGPAVSAFLRDLPGYGSSGLGASYGCPYYGVGFVAGALPAEVPPLAPAVAVSACSGTDFLLGLLCFFALAVEACPESLHELLVPLVGFPPKAQGMSS